MGCRASIDAEVIAFSTDHAPLRQQRAHANSLDLHSVEANYWKQFPLHFAASIACVDEIRRLVAAGVAVNTVDAFRRTPLHIAARSGFVSAVECLLQSGANVHSFDMNKHTPLHEAAAHGHFKAAESILRAGANPRLQNFGGKTPMEIALLNGVCAKWGLRACSVCYRYHDLDVTASE
jgi:ankyrin repeat protein